MASVRARTLFYVCSCLHSSFLHSNWYTHPVLVATPDRGTLTLSNLLDGTVFINMDVQPLGLEVHGLHRVGLEDAVLLGKIGLREGLIVIRSQREHLD
jgi:hypothetical protein